MTTVAIALAFVALGAGFLLGRRRTGHGLPDCRVCHGSGYLPGGTPCPPCIVATQPKWCEKHQSDQHMEGSVACEREDRT